MFTDDDITRECHVLYRALESCARELRSKYSYSAHEATRLMGEYDARACNLSAQMIKILSTEVTRLRLAIEHYEYGKISKKDLVDISSNWNSGSDFKPLTFPEDDFI